MDPEISIGRIGSIFLDCKDILFIDFEEHTIVNGAYYIALLYKLRQNILR